MSTSIANGRSALMALFCIVAAGPSPAAQSPLTLRDALERAISSSPELRAYEFVLRAQDGRIDQANRKPNPSLNANLEDVLGTGATSGVRAGELTLGLSQLIELGGLRDKRVAVARFEREGLEVEGAVRRLELVAETARRFVSLVSQQEQHGLTHLQVSLAEQTVVAVERRVTAAKAPTAERDRAAVALVRARIADAHAEHELLSARYELAASWGSERPDFEAVAADLYALPAVTAFDTLVMALEQTPDIGRYVTETRLRDSEMRLSAASRTPGITLGAGVRRLQEAGDYSLVFTFSAPLPIYNRNEGLVAEARARKEGAVLDREVALLQARTRLVRLYRELQDRSQQVPALKERALPLMEAALKNTEYAFERGRYSYLELVDAQRELLALRSDLIAAATEYHQTLIEIERLTGTSAVR